MKKILMLLILIMLILVGCASKQASEWSPEGENRFTEPIYPHEVTNKINEANRLLDNGDYQEALRFYDELIEEYVSVDGGLECGINTNQAIASVLGLGDRDLFLSYADLVRTRCLNVKHPSYNTVWVLAVTQAIRNERSRDLRIPPGMLEASFQVLRGNGG